MSSRRTHKAGRTRLFLGLLAGAWKNDRPPCSADHQRKTSIPAGISVPYQARERGRGEEVTQPEMIDGKGSAQEQDCECKLQANFLLHFLWISRSPHERLLVAGNNWSVFELFVKFNRKRTIETLVFRSRMLKWSRIRLVELMFLAESGVSRWKKRLLETMSFQVKKVNRRPISGKKSSDS